MTYQTIQKYIGHTPRKLRLVADMVRGMEPYQALQILHFTNKAAAIDLAKAIKTALANAKGENDLYFEKIEINEALKSKRFMYGTAGRHTGRPKRKRFSHIKIVLTTEGKQKKMMKGPIKIEKMVEEESSVAKQAVDVKKTKKESLAEKLVPSKLKEKGKAK